MNIADPSICLWEPAPYFIFSNNIWGDFIYYSHLFPSLSVLLIATFVLINNPKGKAARALFIIASSFTAWSLIDLVVWASDRSDIIMFFWSILIHFEFLMFIASFYFIHALFKNAWPGWKSETAIFLMAIPLFLFAHTPLNLVHFDFTNCWREAAEGGLWQFYLPIVQLLTVVWIAIFTAVEIKRDKTRTKEMLLAATGIVAFLVSFSLGNILGSFETNWELGQWGLFGMPVFVTFLAYILVKYQVFKAKAIATEALVVGQGILIFSLLFINKIENVQIIAATTLIITVVLGVLLIRSVRMEIKQKEELQVLTKKLATANDRLKDLDKLKSEFVSIASHQLRSPLTAIRGYASMVLEGSFGKIPEKAREPIQRIEDSSKLMALGIEDYLNVSRIEAGNMKYNSSDFNLKNEVEKICDDLRIDAVKQGLMLIFRTDLKSKGVVNADIGKTVQVVQNLIHNSIKYTEKGSIKVLMRDDVVGKKIYIDIEDTGIGMSKDTLSKIFQKFERANNANSVNISGTGLGLFVAVKMTEAMGGEIGATSEGDGKGSKFTITLPLAM